MEKLEKEKEKEKLLIIDGHALIHRAFHAIPQRQTSHGKPVNAVYGVAVMLLGLLERERPHYCLVATEGGGQTFRHKQFAGYKASRKEMPPELKGQFDSLYRLIEAFNLPVYKMPGYEADDVIGALAVQATTAGLRTIIATGDADLLQLVNAQVMVVAPGRTFKESIYYDSKGVEIKLGVAPKHVATFKALVGDKSDNYGGVPGIGEKGAWDLIRRFGDAYEIINKIPYITPRPLAEKILKNRQVLLDSLKLATIVTSIPDLHLHLLSASTFNFVPSKANDFFREYEFNYLLNWPFKLAHALPLPLPLSEISKTEITPELERPVLVEPEPEPAPKPVYGYVEPTGRPAGQFQVQPQQPQTKPDGRVVSNNNDNNNNKKEYEEELEAAEVEGGLPTGQLKMF